jgi:hypothetical protein
VCFHTTANQNFRHFSMRRWTAKMAEHSLGVYYPPESLPHLVTHLLLHNKPQYILSVLSCDQSKHSSPSSPDRVSSFTSSESNIYDTLSTGIRPGYNNAAQIGRLVTNYLSTLCNIPEEWISHLHYGRSLKLLISMYSKHNQDFLWFVIWDGEYVWNLVVDFSLYKFRRWLG